MLIKNYYSPNSQSPALDLQIIEDVTGVLVHSGCFNGIGDPTADGINSVYDNRIPPNAAVTLPPSIVRHIDFTNKDGVRSRLIVTNHAYVCNDRGQTVEKVTA